MRRILFFRCSYNILIPLIITLNSILRQTKVFMTIAVKPPCDLPPDFWCDHPETTIACTGSLDFCQKYRTNRAGHPFNIELAFETACPDSQQSITNRFYPKILINEQLASIVNFKALPWGLAHRDTAQKIYCHHGERECIGNRLLRAALYYLNSDKRQRYSILNCFMSRMMARPPDPAIPMAQCLDYERITPAIKDAILKNKNATLTELIAQEKMDEESTHRIHPAFVPFIGINNRGHIHMQAYQLILSDKIRAWNRSIGLIPSRIVAPSRCQIPPDFWCTDDSSFSADCYNIRGCAEYTRLIFNKPIHIRILYNSMEYTSRRYVLDYLRRYFLSQNTFDIVNAGKFILELEPIAITIQNINSNFGCSQDALCLRRIYEECITNKVVDVRERTNQLICLLSKTQDANLTINTISSAWIYCARIQEIQEKVSNCVQNDEWRELFKSRAIMQKALRPNPPQWSPWIVLNNGHSLITVQSFNQIIHRLICIWYRGSGHDRNFCGRCEYEPTHC